MGNEKRDIESLVKHIEILNSHFEKVFQELDDVKGQLEYIQNKDIRKVVANAVQSVNREVTEVPTVIVAAITSQKKVSQRTHVKMDEIRGLPKDSMVLLEQIRTLDKQRLLDYIGKIDKPKFEKIEKALQLCFRSFQIP